MSAQIVRFKLEEDGDIHLILFDQGSYMIAEMPARSCLTRQTRDRREVVSARKAFTRACGAATSSWQALGAVVARESPALAAR